MRSVTPALLLLIIASALHAQIPPSEKLSESDSRLFQAEIDRVKGLLETAGDKCTVQYGLARTWAGGGQYRQAIDALRDAVDLNVVWILRAMTSSRGCAARTNSLC